MIVNHLTCSSMTCAIVIAACGSPTQQAAPDPTKDEATVSDAVTTPREIRGWWDLGDAFGPFTAYYEGSTLVRIQETLSRGDYGSTKAEYHYQNGKLTRYNEESLLRLIDLSDSHRLVPVSFELVFDPEGAIVTGHKSIDRAPADLDPLDKERIRGHARTLEERALAFANAHDLGSTPVRYICGEDETFDVVFYPGGVILDLGSFDGRYLLDRARSTSGEKYADETLTFWTQGDEAFVERHSGRILSDCIGEVKILEGEHSLPTGTRG